MTPDIMTLAKPLAGGLPIGAALLKQHVADVMKPGEDGETCETMAAIFQETITPGHSVILFRM